MDGVILERDEPLATLAGCARAAASGAGTVVLVTGEAGIGKSTLVRAVAGQEAAAGRWLVGYCDDLDTPRVLGPLRDLARQVGPALAAALADGDRGTVADALLDELTGANGASVLVIEDAHWADEATIEVLGYLVRRLAGIPVTLVLTYRDDELAPDHALRGLLGLVARSARPRRIRLRRLTPAAVRALSADAAVDPDRVFGVTSGNPYFVAEVLAAGDADTVPLTIADAVRARVLHLSEPARTVVEQLSVVPAAAESWLVDALGIGGWQALDEAERGGLLAVADDRVAFRHELTRRAVHDGMPPALRSRANARVLEALLARTGVDLSRIVHHAAAAGAREVVLDAGPRAAREAAAAGAHRQAADHLRLVLDHRPQLPAEQEAALWRTYGVECYTISTRSDVARQALERAVELGRGGDPVAMSDSLRWLSRMCWWAGDVPGATAAGEQAISVLVGTGHDGELAMIFSNQSQLHALAGREDEAVTLAQRALELAGDDPSTRSHALNNLGLARCRSSWAAGRPHLVESLRIAREARDTEQICRAYVNLVWNDIQHLRLDEAERSVQDAIAHAERAEFLLFAGYLQLELAMLAFARGQWDRVVGLSSPAIDGARPFRASALALNGQLQARQGVAEAADLLDEAWELAVQVGECQRIGPAASASAEAAELAGDPRSALERLRTAYELAVRCGTPPVRAELAYRMGRAGEPVPPPEGDHPYAVLARGDWATAAGLWREAGCPYETAVALTHSPEPEDLLEALALLDGLGAEPLAALVRATLRLKGIARVPRGPAAATRSNPAGLTERQLDVVRLLAEGLTNAEIAAALVLSVRTVDSHVAAAFDKLGARTRREAAQRARELGVST